MAGRAWYDDSDYHDAVQQAERATRFGWEAITGAAGALGRALIAMAVVCAVAVITCLYVVIASNY